MRMIRIGILETGNTRPELLAEHGSFASWFERLFTDSRLNLVFETFVVYNGELPTSATLPCDAYMITGSAASANDDEDWIRKLEQFLRVAAESVPIIAVCFGHQVIHKALGGRVVRAEQGWGVGIHDYDLINPPEWLNAPPDRLSFCASHNDQVIDTAPGTQIIARSEFCPIAATTIGDNVLTVQSHPEMSKDFSRAIYNLRRDLLGEELTDSAIASLTKSTNEEAFIDMVEQFLAPRLGLQAPQPTARSA